MKQEKMKSPASTSGPKFNSQQKQLPFRILSTEKSPANQTTQKPGAIHKQESKDKGQGIPKNINFYRHLMDSKFANENGVEWVLKLRTPKADSHPNEKLETYERFRPQVIQRTVANPPSFAGTKLECQTQGRRTNIDVDNLNALHQVTHLFSKRIGPTPTNGQVNFESGLRTYGNKELRDRERKWTNVPFKDKKDQLPRLYPSYEETLKIKTWSTKNLQIKTYPAFNSEGYLNYPPYNEIEDYQPRNCSETKHLYYPGQLMSTVNWELSMRQILAKKLTYTRDYGERMRKKSEIRESVKQLRDKVAIISKTKAHNF